MQPKTIAIVGAGPKAAAIVARVLAMESLLAECPLLPEPPHVLVLEKAVIGHAWADGSGFSNGVSTLCNPAEMDVGFPYLHRWRERYPRSVVDTQDWGHLIADRLHQDFSWPRFLSARERTFHYIARGRRFPPHSQWQEYLRWVMERESSYVQIFEQCDVKKAWLKDAMSINRPQWRIECETSRGPVTKEVDGIVLTGTGEPIRVADIEPEIAAPKLLDASSFWQHRDHFERMRADVRSGIVSNAGAETRPVITVVGAGGAAATILGWLCEHFAGLPVILQHVSANGAFFPRGEGYAERQWYVDPEGWMRLPIRVRRDILARSGAGAISPLLKEAIERADSIKFIAGRVGWIGSLPEGSATPAPAYRLWRETPDRYGGTKAKCQLGHYSTADCIIQALGFDAWSTLGLIHDPGGTTRYRVEPFVRQFKDPVLRRHQAASRRAMEERIDANLAIPLGMNLHVPGLAGLQGPGLPNLGTLGQMAARILDRYLSSLRGDAEGGTRTY